MNMYRMESEKYVLAFSWETQFDEQNQAVKSDTTGFHGTSNTWKLEIVDTFAEDPSSALYNYTYFTGIEIFVNNGEFSDTVRAKFVPVGMDCSTPSAMIDPAGDSNTVLEEVRMDACSGLLERFKVSDISQTYHLCYAQTDAPNGYNDFISYDISFMIRNTQVESEGYNNFAIVGYEKTLYLDAGEYVPTSIKFVVEGKSCSDATGDDVFGPFEVTSNNVTILFDIPYESKYDGMRLCVQYGDEEIYEPQQLVMNINAVMVPNPITYWTTHEPYVLNIEGRFLYGTEGDVYVSGGVLNNTNVTISQVTEAYPDLGYSIVNNGVANIAFTSHGEEEQLYMFALELGREIPLRSNMDEDVMVTVYTVSS